ncbi:hypothetical protein R3P38DRAFT_2860529 [Favolaschia claudopus]|uniref:Uncharacterized protein n=1 Tax=Favolaschia claudopus TaxID=2862362 RepID=A0AAW0DMJ2_9AGAR
MHFPRSLFAPHALLDDSTCDLLASVGPIESLDMLKQLLESGWSHWERFGNHLYVYLHNLNIPPLPLPPPRQKSSSSTASSASAPQLQLQGGSTAKKRSHSTHGTSADPAANPSQRRRGEALVNTPRTPSTSTLAPAPQSHSNHGYFPRPIPSSPLAHQSVPTTPRLTMPTHDPRYLPATPIHPSTIPSTYPLSRAAPASYYTAASAPFYSGHPYYASYSYPSQIQPHYTSHNPPSTPASLHNNPYAALASPAFSFPSPSPVTSLSHPVTTSPTPSHPSSAPSSSSFTPDPGPNNSTSG